MLIYLQFFRPNFQQTKNLPSPYLSINKGIELNISLEFCYFCCCCSSITYYEIMNFSEPQKLKTNRLN
jgi:hypothetical protein